ncbi:uncharacterized protein LOC131251339 [Magnolia sinica]|uniref:uncharacterized protein LOC131251339 n=1 Tax=Magnolia sinica TaxID=86752 RepID=UPI00265910D9|nr:uncharacterized protein LOC131251339 [Magnolia sinica]
MALHIGSSSSSHPTHLLTICSFRPRNPTILSPISVGRTSETHIARARRVSSRTKKSGLTTSPREEEQLKTTPAPFPEDRGGDASAVNIDDGFVMPELPGDKPDFWEGPQWNAFGFFVQYQWAFGIGFALIACGIAVATYNEGATDFKQTPTYKESIQSGELFDEPEASSSDVFEGNPTEEAPSLE